MVRRLAYNIVPTFLEGPRRPTVWIEYKSGHAAESDWDFYTPVKESQISKLNMWGIPRLSSAVKVKVESHLGSNSSP
ncbi:uncharacterized protein N7525_009969 [Penicillium rubens]|uniref:uncharacterized protein n=1 Tax=Penicillium rubens TaxID=1108849 RepID=UPI002A5A88F7|nr:uncharacterized protein N7525_009969 [Penicillium rubens]KAJ5820685.1 hypothetical protein N7525_009969 [Penicillium rubens]KAJ5848802.1 hypothetical protein N7534_008120 [Penicillium rubens]